MKTLIAAGAVLALAGAAVADSPTSTFVDLTGFSAAGGFTAPGGGVNSETFLTLGAGTQIIDIEFVDLVFESFGFSWNSELIVSVNDSDGVGFGQFWDSFVPGAGDNSGVYGPTSGSFTIAGAGGGAFTMAEDDLYITVFEALVDGFEPDSTILSGGILITYKPIPTPGSAALLGLAGLAAVRRRR